EKRSRIVQVLKGGPAERVGVQQNDLIEEIDGLDTLGMDTAMVVERLRGDEGTDVVIKVLQPGAAAARTLRITRQSLSHPTILGLQEFPGKEGALLLGGKAPIGYLKFQRIGASTPRELRQMAGRLESEGAQALVLDLRTANGANYHAAVLLADCLLDGG